MKKNTAANFEAQGAFIVVTPSKDQKLKRKRIATFVYACKKS